MGFNSSTIIQMGLVKPIDITGLETLITSFTFLTAQRNNSSRNYSNRVLAWSRDPYRLRSEEKRRFDVQAVIVLLVVDECILRIPPPSYS